MSNLTIAIITKDRSENLRETLEHLTDMELDDDVLVIDGSNTIKTSQICRKNNITVHSQESNGMTAARNEALSHCNTEYIAFIDDDSFISDSWYECITKNLDKGYSGVTGKLLDERPKIHGFARIIRHLIFGGENRFGEVTEYGVINGDFFYDHEKLVDHMPGCNMAYNVKDLKQVNGFDEDIDVGNSYREDTIASYKVSQIGEILYAPDASVDHKAIEESGDTEKWHFYNPYLTQYFLNEYNVISGNINHLKFWGIQVLRHIYFGVKSVKNTNLNYLYYLSGELMGIKDFVLSTQKPKKYV